MVAPKNSNESNSSKNQTKEALNQMKFEIANQLGVNLKEGYNGDLTSKEAGSIGGNMVKQLIESAEQQMTKKK